MAGAGQPTPIITLIATHFSVAFLAPLSPDILFSVMIILSPAVTQSHAVVRQRTRTMDGEQTQC